MAELEGRPGRSQRKLLCAPRIRDLILSAPQLVVMGEGGKEEELRVCAKAKDQIKKDYFDL